MCIGGLENNLITFEDNFELLQSVDELKMYASMLVDGIKACKVITTDDTYWY
jgi:hypothetical protein